MSTPSICIWTCVLFLHLPNNMHLVLFMFNDTLFLSHHLYNLHISEVVSSLQYLCHLQIANFTIFDTLQILFKAEIILDPVLTPGGRHKQCPNTTRNIKSFPVS